MNKTKSITFRVSEHDKKSIVARAREAKMKTSDFCRYTALGKEIVNINGLKEVVFELNKLGNNINQMTVLMHQKRIDNPNLAEIGTKLSGVFDHIEMCLNGGDASGDS